MKKAYTTFEDDLLEMLENEQKQEWGQYLFDNHDRYVPMLREDLITRMNGSVRRATN